jgi:glycosyltransferase involved in cell wall biosynthesis
MKVAFDARSLVSPVLRGWDRYTVSLARALVRQGVEVTFFHRARQPLHADHCNRVGCEVRSLDDLCGVHWEQVAVPLALARGQFDIYHAPAETGVPLAAPCPVVLTLHSATRASYKDMLRRGVLPGSIEQYLGPQPRRIHRVFYQASQLRRATHVLTPSEFSRGEIVSLLGFAPERVTVTPLAADEEFHRPRRELAAIEENLARLGVRRPYLLYVGGYEPHKNVRGLLDVFACVHRVRSELTLVTVGSKGLPAEMPAKAADLGLCAGRAVVFLINLSKELTDLYDGAELFLTMSWRESFCLPALEAMTRGRQVVGSAWGALGEVVGDSGRLVDPRNIPQAANEVLTALESADDPVTAARVRRRAAEFDWDRAADQTLEVYVRLAKKQRHGTSAEGRRR